MDAFFVQTRDFVHPYQVRMWAASSYEKAPLLMSYDGVKLRLYDYSKGEILLEKDYLNHEDLSKGIAIHSNIYPSRAIFIVVRDRRNLVAFDDGLKIIDPLTFDTSIIILSMVWSEKRQTLYISGNFGWMRALNFTVSSSISGVTATWEPGWSVHEANMWVTALTLDEKNGYIIGGSNTDVYFFNVDDGSILLRFNSQHTMAISNVRYSMDRLMLYTSSADGTIKSWRVFERKPQLVNIIKQARLGPIMMELDGRSLITMSHERILRRYNMMTSNIIAEINLDVTTPIDAKDVEASLRIALVESDGRQWILQSEGFHIHLLEALFAPRELSVCCDVVNDLAITQDNNILAFCRNNVVHEIPPNGSEGRTFDFDTMVVQNFDSPHTIAHPETKLYIDKNNIVYAGFQTGEIKALDLKTGELFEMNEPNKNCPIRSLSTVNNILQQRHTYCTSSESQKTFIMTNGLSGGFTFHCLQCCNFIGSWKITETDLIQITQIEDKPFFVCLEKSKISLFKIGDTITQIDSLTFDQFDYGHSFVFADPGVIAVAMTNGKVAVYELHEDIKPAFNNIFTLKMHNDSIVKLLSTYDLLKINGGKEVYEREDLKGYVAALSKSHKLTIADTLTGTIAYSCDLPSYHTSITAALIPHGVLMIALAVDQNMRLLHWPNITRYIPPKIESESEEEEVQVNTGLKPFRDTSSDEDDDVNPITYYTQYSNRAKPTQSPLHDIKIETTLNSRMSSDAILKSTQSRFVIPDEESKKTMVIEYDENGWPKIVIKTEKIVPNIEEVPEEQIQSSEEEEEEEEVFQDESMEIEDKIEIPDKQKLFIGEMLKQSEEREKTVDEIMIHNRKLIEKALAENPLIKDTFERKAVKRIVAKEYYTTDDDEFDDNIFNFFLTMDVRSFRPKTLTNRITNSPRDFEAHQQQYNTNLVRTLMFREPPEGIKPIGNRKKAVKKHKKNTIVIEFEDGTRVRTDSHTAAVLATMVADDPSSSSEETGLTPGYIFQKALKELDNKRQNRQKKLIVMEQNLMALPIMTMVSGGFALGANQKRFFDKDAPLKRFVTSDDTKGSYLVSSKDGQISKLPFMHWEGVLFNSDRKHKKNQKFQISNIIEDKSDDDDEDSAEHNPRFPKLPLHVNTKIHSTRSEKSNQDESEEDTFDLTSDQLKMLAQNSPSIMQVEEIFGGSSNPLLDLLSQTPNMSTDQVLESFFKPQNNNIGKGLSKDMDTFPSLGMGLPGLGIPAFGGNRPLSPRPANGLGMLYSGGFPSGPPNFMMPIIDENLTDLSIIESESEDDFTDDTDEDDLFASEKHVQQSQAAVQERLRRNDFQGLRNLLDQSGLLDDDAFIDLPKWQPMIDFVSLHNPKEKKKPPQPSEQEQEEKTGTLEEVNITPNDKMNSSKSAEFTSIEKKTMNIPHTNSTPLSPKISGRKSGAPSKPNSGRTIPLEDASEEFASNEQSLELNEEEEQYTNISDSDFEDVDTPRHVEDFDSQEYEEEIFEEEECQEMGDDGQMHTVKYKISKGIIKKFKRSTIGEAKTRRTTNYSDIKYQSGGPRKPNYDENEFKRRQPGHLDEEERQHGEIKIAEGLKFERKPVKIKKLKKFNRDDDEEKKTLRKRIKKTDQDGKKKKKNSEKNKRIKIKKSDAQKAADAKIRRKRKRKLRINNLNLPQIKDPSKSMRAIPRVDLMKEEEVDWNYFDRMHPRSEGGTPRSQRDYDYNYSDDSEIEIIVPNGDDNGSEYEYEYEYEYEEPQHEYEYEYEYDNIEMDFTDQIRKTNPKLLVDNNNSSQNHKQDQNSNDENESGSASKKTRRDKIEISLDPIQRNVGSAEVSPKNQKKEEKKLTIMIGPVKASTAQRRRRTVGIKKPKEEEKPQEVDSEGASSFYDYYSDYSYDISPIEEENVIVEKEKKRNRTSSEKIDTSALDEERERLRREEEEALLNQLLQNGTVEGIETGFDDLYQKKEDGKPLYQVTSPEKRPTHVGTKVELKPFGEFPNSDYQNQTKIPSIDGDTWERAGYVSYYHYRNSNYGYSSTEFSNSFDKSLSRKYSGNNASAKYSAKFRIARSFSHDNILKKERIERHNYAMFNEQDLMDAEEIFLSYYAPTLWDYRRGKTRKNSE